MTANFFQVKVSSNGMIGIHSKNPLIVLRPTEVQGLIQDLVYARKAISRMSDPRIIDEMNYDTENIYLKALIGIIATLKCKEIMWKCIKGAEDI